MRNFHRWGMTVFAVILAYWVGSGLIIAIYDATDHTQVWALEGAGPGARLNDGLLGAAAIPPPAALASGISRSLAAAGSMAIASVELRMDGGVARLQFAEASGKRDTMRRFDAATGAQMAAADSPPDAHQPANVVRRNDLKSWHRGNVAGLAGQIVGLLAGIGLIALTVTGIGVYLSMWSARRRAGRRGLFWSAKEGGWRRLHRWIGIVAAAFVLNIAISGVILAYGEIWIRLALQYHLVAPPYPRPSPMPPVSADVLPRDLNALLQRTYQAATAASPNATIVALQLVRRGGVSKGLAVLAGAPPQTLAFDAATGAPVSDWSGGGTQVGNGYFADWHQVVKRIHRGDIIGTFNGRYIDIGAGLALLYLVVSSGVMYLQLLQRRRRIGRDGLFWK